MKAWKRAKKEEESYARKLRKIANHVGDVVGAFEPGTRESAAAIDQILSNYSVIIEPYATAVAWRMITDVNARDHADWIKASRRIGEALSAEIDSAPTGFVMRKRLADQVALIKSLPLEAAERVHKLTIEGISNGRRASAIVDEIRNSGNVTKSRATLIARTETTRTATELRKARAESVGSTHFIWRTAEDSDVRPTHRKLNGKVFRWDDPPECDPGIHALPGCVFNCRCYSEPVISDT